LPADFLLPLFAVTLLANAVLVAFAIRGMRRGLPEIGRPTVTGRPSKAPVAAHRTPIVMEPTAREPMAPEPAAPEPTATEPPAPEPTPAASVEAVSVEPAPTEEPAPPAADTAPNRAAPPTATDAVDAAVSPQKRRRTSKSAAAPAAPAGPRPAEARRGRRRFSLPPLDDDHEKVRRSIETFLGVDAEGTGLVVPDPESRSFEAPPTEAGSGPTTVALIAVAGLPERVATSGTERRATRSRGRAAAPASALPGDDPRDGDAIAAALAMVERTLRGAARGTDVVTNGERGRFRIVMPSTGELAARAYLRRIRASIEPGLEAAGPPLRLAVATATVLDEPLERAVRRAEERLSVALGAGPADATSRQSTTDRAPGLQPDDESFAPRAAAD
jgi:hypothetical protein